MNFGSQAISGFHINNSSQIIYWTNRYFGSHYHAGFHSNNGLTDSLFSSK